MATANSTLLGIDADRTGDVGESVVSELHGRVDRPDVREPIAGTD
jgi:hypothetical protein